MSNMNSFLNEKNNLIPVINIYRKTSIAPDVAIERKKFNIVLHTLEPLGIEVMENTKVEISINGNDISGFGNIALHDLKNITLIKEDISLNKGNTFTVPRRGQLFLDVKNIKYKLNQDIPFSFKVNIGISESSRYTLTPIFDIRKNKISDKAITDEKLFKYNLGNSLENGMLMISENVRIYFPKNKYVPKEPELSLKGVLDFHENIISEYNKLAGLVERDSNRLNKPRRNFVLVSARSEHVGDLSAGSMMLDTSIENAGVYFKSSFDVFKQYGKLYEQEWGFSEIWSSLYAFNMINKTGSFNWLGEKNRFNYENKYILNFYKDYFINNKELYRNFALEDGLYFLITLKERLGEKFISNITKYYLNNALALKDGDFLAYAIADIFNVNIIPYMQLYGYNNLSKNTIESVVSKSYNIVFIIPNTFNFNEFNRISIPATLSASYSGRYITIKVSGTRFTQIKVVINGVLYNKKTDVNGKISFLTPNDINRQAYITISTIQPGKYESPVKKVVI